jgi:hypothetical protein
MVVEQIHRYPRWITWLIELLCFLAVGAALLQFGRDLLLMLWRALGLDTTLLGRVPYLPEIVLAISGGAPLPRRAESTGLLGVIMSLGQLMPALGWLALALLLALLLRNSLPTIRTSPRGMLVEFSGGWLPIPWESLRAIKVTEDLAAERFVLLAEADAQQLTGWHRFYSLFYRFGFRRSFLIISAISDFQALIKTLLAETDRVARVLENVKPARLQEEASSPLFRLVLSPASFFSRRTKAEAAAAAEVLPSMSGRNTLAGAYPRRISTVFSWGAGLLVLLALWRYVVYWLKFLALTFPALKNLPVFNQLTLFQLPANWWLLVAAHLLLALVLWLASALANLLPDLEARSEGLAVRNFGRWQLVPWAAISAIKVTELSDQSRIVLIQARRGLPGAKRLSSAIYEGSLAPGVLVTSALSNFEQVLQRVVLEVSRGSGTAGETPQLQSEARSDLLLLSFRSSAAIDQLVAESREDEQTKVIEARRLTGAAGRMAWLALPPALLLLFDRAIQQGILPSPTLIITVVVLFVLGMLEWPLVGLALTMLDEMTGGGEEGNRAFYLYPTSQLPRLLPQLGALLLVLLGVPILPVLLWLGAIVWSFLLAAALSEELYDWRGGQLFAGGLIPVVFQLLILLAYLIVSR